MALLQLRRRGRRLTTLAAAADGGASEGAAGIYHIVPPSPHPSPKKFFAAAAAGQRKAWGRFLWGAFLAAALTVAVHFGAVPSTHAVVDGPSKVNNAGSATNSALHRPAVARPQSGWRIVEKSAVHEPPPSSSGREGAREMDLAVCVVGAVRSFAELDVVRSFRAIAFPGNTLFFHYLFVGEELSLRGQGALGKEDAEGMARALGNSTAFRLQYQENEFTCGQMTTGKFYKLSACMQMIDEYSRNEGVSFKAIAFVRPDLQWTCPEFPAYHLTPTTTNWYVNFLDEVFAISGSEEARRVATSVTRAECCDAEKREPPSCFLPNLQEPRPNFMQNRHFATHLQQTNQAHAGPGRGALRRQRCQHRIQRTKEGENIIRQMGVHRLHGKARETVLRCERPQTSRTVTMFPSLTFEEQKDVLEDLLAVPHATTCTEDLQRPPLKSNAAAKSAAVVDRPPDPVAEVVGEPPLSTKQEGAREIDLAVCVLGAVRSFAEPEVVQSFQNISFSGSVAFFHYLFVGKELSARGQEALGADDAAGMAHALANSTAFRFQYQENEFICDQMTTGKFYKISACTKMIEEYSRNEGISFKAIAFTRPDLRWRCKEFTPYHTISNRANWFAPAGDEVFAINGNEASRRVARDMMKAQCCDPVSREPASCFLNGLNESRANFIQKRHFSTHLQTTLGPRRYCGYSIQRSAQQNQLAKSMGMRGLAVLHGKYRSEVLRCPNPQTSPVVTTFPTLAYKERKRMLEDLLSVPYETECKHQTANAIR